jgi:hypothetical protein
MVAFFRGEKGADEIENYFLMETLQKKLVTTL